jgi:uncharacterized membrane protein YciS (DUF1049 family)
MAETPKTPKTQPAKPHTTSVNSNATSAKTGRTSSKAKKSPKFKLPTRQKVYYAIFVLAWTAFAITASQFIIIYPMIWILGESFTEPFWTFIYYILYNALALTLVILVPPKLAALYRRNHNAKGDLKPASQARLNRAKAEKAIEAPRAVVKPTAETDELFSTNPEELGVSSWPTFVDIGLAPIAYFAYAVLTNIIINIFTSFPWFNADQEQNVGFNGYFITTSDRIFAMLAIVFIAPIAEELIMRGWLYGKLRNKFKIPLAIFLTSILFAVLHGQLNVGISVFILSVILCGLREITGTIWSGMLLHILSNGIAFYAIYIAL